jgi:hypothetical protein
MSDFSEQAGRKKLIDMNAVPDTLIRTGVASAVRIVFKNRVSWFTFSEVYIGRECSA